MVRYGSFIFLLACVDGKINPNLLEAEEDVTLSDQDGDGFAPVDGDCDDENASVYPEAVDICDGIDNDCDSTIDEESIQFYWAEDKAKWDVGAQVQQLQLDIDHENWLAEPFSDGIVDTSISYLYKDGRLISETRVRGNQQLQIDYTYNAEGWLMEETWSTNQVMRHVWYSYDSTGSLLRRDTDDGADGVIEHQLLYQYQDGFLVAQDELEDGVQVRSQTWVYEDGLLVSMSERTEDSLVEYRYSGSVDDGVRSVIVDVDADGTIDEEYTQWYDDGAMFKEGRNLDGIEGFELISSWEYGTRGLQQLRRVQSAVGSEEYIDVEETSLHHYTMTHDIDSSFWEQSHEKFLTITCAEQEVEEAE